MNDLGSKDESEDWEIRNAHPLSHNACSALTSRVAQCQVLRCSCIALIFILATLPAAAALVRPLSAEQPITVDLTQWTPPDITKVGHDGSGTLVRYGYALFADTANQIGPTVSDFQHALQL